MSRNYLGQLEKLSPGEKLLLERRRKGETQSEAAKRHNVPYSRYGMWERDEGTGVPKVKIEKLEAHERCLLYRRRAEVTQDAVAEDLNLSRWWINQMERGEANCNDLIEYWEC